MVDLIEKIGYCIHSVWVTIQYYGPCKIAVTQLQGRFRPWKRQYYEKRFLPAYSTALRAPQTRGGKIFLIFQNSIRRSLMMQYEITCFNIWSTLDVAQTYLIPLTSKSSKWIKKRCPWSYLNSIKCAPSYSYLVFLVMVLHFGFLFNQKNGKRIQPICLLFLLPQCRILIQLSKNTLRNLNLEILRGSPFLIHPRRVLF